MKEKTAEPVVRTGLAEWPLSREEFEQRFRRRFYDPVFAEQQEAIQSLLNLAWDGYIQARKSPVTRKAGEGFADREYEISVEWLATRDAMRLAQQRHDDAARAPRVLLICGAARNDKTCPGEMSKTFRMVQMAKSVLASAGAEVDLLDLPVTPIAAKLQLPATSSLSGACGSWTARASVGSTLRRHRD